MDPQHLVQRSVERGAMIAELLPQLLLLLSVGEGGRLVDTLLAQARTGGVGRRGLDAASRAPGHHVAVPTSNKRPRVGIGGWRGQACPLVPPGRLDVVIRDFHRRRMGLPARAGSCRASTTTSDRASVAAGSCCGAATAASSRVSAAAGAERLSTADAAGNATTTGAAGCTSASGCASVAAVACCATTTAGARRASATIGCGPVGIATGQDLEASAAPCETLLAATAAPAPACDALNERHLVGTDTSALSTFAGARGGTVGAAL
jgi:hypothetical protein